MTQKKIKASDVIGNSYYIYTLTSTNYTPSLNGTINITCTVTNIYGQTVSGKQITLYQNSTSKGAKTTASNGTASWNSISMTTAGVQVFSVENSQIIVLVDNKADSDHTHSGYLTSSDLANYVTDDDTRLSNARTPLSHTHGNLQNNGQVGSTVQANKNVVTNSSGLITTEDKPTVPSASTTTPSADTTSGDYGSGTTYARSNHTHPKSSIYAEASHEHTKSEITDFPSIPSASTTTPSADTESGSYGSGTTYARSDHKHPKSSLYAESSHTHDNYLTSSDITGKIDTAGTGLSKSGTTLNHSNNVTALTTASLKKVKYDSTGHITGTSDVSASDLPSHTHNYSTFSGSYSDLTNKPSYTATVTSSTTGSYKIGSINISGSNVDIYGKDTDTHQSLTNYIQKSNTNGLIKNDGTIDTTTYLTSHQDISGKEDTSNKVSSWSSTTNDTRYPTEKLVKDSLNGKSNTGHEHNASEIWADYEASGGYLNHITLDARLEEIESKIPTNNPLSDTESGLTTILTYIDTNWEDY